MAIASPASQKLAKYRAKRDFTKTNEPLGTAEHKGRGNAFVIQKHAATRLHYDFRLELDGVLKSWAVTKGPSLNPLEKRLAVHVEDHPLDYGSFEGTIPQGQYGGGTVMLWDRGTWTPAGDPRRAYAKGNLTFELDGERLKGRWHLVRMHGSRRGDGNRENWLLIKGRDEYADENGEAAVEQYLESVVSGRSMEAIAGGKGKSWTRAGARRKSKAEAEEAVSALQKQERRAERQTKTTATAKSSTPQVMFVAPELATLVSKPPTGDDWVHEIKFDGYRLLALIEDGDARLFTRAANDWTARFQPIRAALTRLKVKSAVIDGEVVHVAADGTQSFHSLQNALSTEVVDGLRYYAFDLLQLDGVDLRSKPLLERKATLKGVLSHAPERIVYSEHFAESGDKMLGHACRLALEGIVSKRADSPYRSGRTDDWLKSKCIKEQELVIGGYVEQPKHPGMLGAMLIGYYEGDALRFAGKVGTGFTHAEGRSLLKRLAALRVERSAFSSVPTEARRGAVFVKPKLVAQVNFSEWTPDGRLRHPSFQGLREDKSARDVTREKEKPLSVVQPAAAKKRRLAKRTSGRTPPHTSANAVAGITITHPDRVLWPEQGITKLDLARYYAAIAPRLLAHAGDRPMSLVRCPQGDIGQCFFQRHAGEGMSDHLKAVKVEGRGEGKPYIYIDDAAGLVALVQMGTIELHVWNASEAGSPHLRSRPRTRRAVGSRKRRGAEGQG
jgi:bifunctional non-homologous end joining protein LigD